MTSPLPTDEDARRELEYMLAAHRVGPDRANVRNAADVALAEKIIVSFRRSVVSTPPTVTDEQAVEVGARAAAILGDYDGCFERIDEWNALEQWERDAHPEEAPTTDYEDAEFWRTRVRAALAAVAALGGEEQQ